MKKNFLDLGLQPLANDFRFRFNKSNRYKLAVSFDSKTKLVSITKHLKSKMMFNSSYPYRSGKSLMVKKLFHELSTKLNKKFYFKNILEIGSNDGTFASNFDKKKIVCIEPCTEVANEIIKKGYTTFIKYFDIKLVKILKKKYKTFDLIFSANTITHISNLNNVVSNLKKLISDNGIIIIEDPSFLKCIKNNSYDQFYNEHIYVLSAIAFRNVLDKHGLEIFDLENIEVHGGSIRYFIKKKINKNLIIKKRVANQIKAEKKAGLEKFSTYQKFAHRTLESKKKLVKKFNELKLKGKTIIGYGATAKAVTVVNYCNLKEKYFSNFIDTTKGKIGKLLPGTKIKVLRYKKLRKDKNLYVFLGAWNFKKEILKKENFFFKNHGNFITHIPYPRIINKKNFRG